jgi:integrase
MALYQRDAGVWYADYYADGKRVQESTGTRNRREAEKFLALRISEVHRGVFVKAAPVPLPELWERYLAYARTHKRSWKRDEQMYGNLSRFFGAVNLDAITPLRVEEFQQSRAEQVAPATVNRETALLKHMFNMAERWEMHRGRNPVRLVNFLPENNLQFKTLSEDEERRLLAASPPYLREMILFALNIGLRTNEIFNLKWEEVDIEQRRLKMIVKKNQRPLSIPLNDAAFGVVESRLGIQHGPYVFYSPMTGDRFRDVKGALAAAVKRAGLGKVTWHMFRHTFASRLTRGGVDIVTVKDLLGHSNISTTLRYAHSNDEAKRRAVERLATSDKVVTIVPRRSKTANML